ncbi:hypothetical protein COV82_00805 [Candidatus Peregrinibacteria bacterium CG11_big_fil_rev_8_21_14_0_20_46_8]|nr:MAG: hypothetical protein COV82_00805 [Candidatus Peregrinibacteria bacterium CG11_big_fil_rev_8_21_14_0_20_46_8]
METATAPYEEQIDELHFPDEFDGLTPTAFERLQGPQYGKLTFIIPGFGISAQSIGLDATLWKPEQNTVLSHRAITQKTRHDFLFWQYERMIEELNPNEFSIAAMSLGGSTAVQFLKYLQQKNPALFRRCTKLVTLCAPVMQDDLSQTWQLAAKHCIELDRLRWVKDASRSLLMRAAEAGAKSIIQLASLEIRNDKEATNVLAFAGNTFANAEQANLPERTLEVPITSLGFETDRMVTNANVARFSTAGQHRIMPGKHSSRSIVRNKAEINQAISDALRT